MQRFIFSTLAVLVSASAVAPIAHAADIDSQKTFNVHQLRTENFDLRNKSFEVKDGFNVHQLRTTNADLRNKSFEVKDDFSMHQLYLVQ
jgi:hypothetical protein